VSRPEFLYHGSRVLVPVLEPRVGPVNAAHDRHVALPYALGFLPGANDKVRWTLMGARLVMNEGSVDPSSVGYLYRVPSDGFEPVNRMVWVCREPVTPIDHEVISGADYVAWATSARE
jgi:hypothetical protein